ncbi:MAG: ATP-binding protein [Nitrososphaeraceae archaeon]|nr:ATP-binding protein [Nitrososphaeraceae archaeon]
MRNTNSLQLDDNKNFVDSNRSIDNRSIFGDIVGYTDIKQIFKMSLESESPVHILLVGPPASAKTLFMLECIKLERSFFTLGSHSTKAGMIDYLFENRPRYLLIDEIEYMPYKDQSALLSLMETGILTETKSQKTRKTLLKTWVFATCNNKDKLLTPILSRFMIFHLKPYKRSKFIEISNCILVKNGTSFEIANIISELVWDKLKSKDIRDTVKIAKLAKTKDDVIMIANALSQYR